MKTISLAGREFPLRDNPPKMGRIMLVARAEKRGDEMEQMAVYLDLLESMLSEGHDEADFEQAIAGCDLEEIGKALTEAAEQYKVDPSSARRATSSGSSDGSQTGRPTSRVVSLSPGAIEEAS